jgi:hypothetical protein
VAKRGPKIHVWTLLEFRGQCRETLTGCWEWAGELPKAGAREKEMRHNGKRYEARRLAYLLVFGKEAPTESVAGEPLRLAPVKCGNMRCCNPFHCRPASVSEQCKIASRAGVYDSLQRRIAITQAAHRGERAKLNWPKVDAIRALKGKKKSTQVAPEFNVADSLIRRVWSGKAWPENSRPAGV